jgi:hypothetical protein
MSAIQRRLGFLPRHGSADIEGAIRQDTGWQRPTWPLGRLGGRIDLDKMADPLGILRDAKPQPRTPPRRAEAPPELRAALGVLELDWPLDPAILKAATRSWPSATTPTRMAGDRRSEERFKDISRAYALLRKRLGDAQSAAGPAASPAAAG